MAVLVLVLEKKCRLMKNLTLENNTKIRKYAFSSMIINYNHH